MITIDELYQPLPNTLVEIRFRANSSVAMMDVNVNDSFRRDYHPNHEIVHVFTDLHSNILTRFSLQNFNFCSVLHRMRDTVDKETPNRPADACRLTSILLCTVFTNAFTCGSEIFGTLPDLIKNTVVPGSE